MKSGKSALLGKNAFNKEITGRKKKWLFTFGCKVLRNQSQVEGGASSVRPSLGSFDHYDTLNTGGAGKHRGREAVNEFGREQLLNKSSA